MQDVSARVLDGRRERDHGVVDGHAARRRHGRVQAERLAHDAVEERERVQFFHRGHVGVDGEELLAELCLDLRLLAEGVEAPGRRCACGLVAGDEECRDL